MFTKSSMMGALGVVPEENDSEAENEGKLRGELFGFKRSTTTKRLFEYSKNWAKSLVEKQCFVIIDALFQLFYIKTNLNFEII